MESTAVEGLNMDFKEELSSETKGKYLTFWTEEQLYGIPVADVVQIVGLQTITEIPEYPSFIKGIINLRGSMIPVIDVRLRLGKRETEYDDRTCIIVTSMQEREFGFIVDSVDEVLLIEDESISPPPKVSADDTLNQYIAGIGQTEKGMVLILMLRKILENDGFIIH